MIEALAAIEQLSREALAELGHLLGALRREPDDDPARRPAPTLGALGALVATTRAAGVPVDLEVDGHVRPLSPGVERSAARSPTAVVLMDIRMPVLDGIAATRRILDGDVESAAGRGPVRVVVLTTYDLDEYVYDALRAGACGFLLKHAPPEALVPGSAPPPTAVPSCPRR